MAPPFSVIKTSNRVKIEEDGEIGRGGR